MNYLERVIDKILIVDNNIQDKEVSSVISILPIMVIVLFFFGIFAFVSHMVRGEKEQKVLKTIIRRDGTVENQSTLSKEEENLSWNDLNKFSWSDLNKMREDPDYISWKTKSVETVADMIISQSATHTINGNNTFVNLSKNEETIAENKEIAQEKPKQGAIRSFRK